MKKRILSCVLALVLLLTLLPAAAAATEADTTDTEEARLWVDFYDYPWIDKDGKDAVYYDGPRPVEDGVFGSPDNAQSCCVFSYGTKDERTIVTDVSATGTLELRKRENNNDPLDDIEGLYLIWSTMPGTVTLTYTVKGEQKTQNVKIPLPDVATFTSSSYSDEAYRRDFTYDGRELSFWLLSKDGLTALPTVEVLVNGERTILTEDEDGWYGFSGHKNFLKMALEYESGEGRADKQGIHITLSAGHLFSQEVMFTLFFYKTYVAPDSEQNEWLGNTARFTSASGTPLYQDMWQSGGNTWTEGGERKWSNFPSYGETIYGAQRIWIEYQGEKHRVTNVESVNGCYTIKKIENGTDDPLFQFTAAKLGSDTLRFTADDISIDYAVDASLPYRAFYSSGMASADTYLASSQYAPRCTGEGQTFWFLTRENMSTLSSLKLNGQTLTLAADGAYYYSLYGKNVLRAEWAARQDGQGSGLKLTLLAAANSLPLRRSDCEIRLELSAKAEAGYTNTYSANLELQPDYRIYICDVGTEGNQLVPREGRMRIAQEFDLTGRNGSYRLAFYYYDPVKNTYTDIPVSDLKITGENGSAVTDGIELTAITETNRWEAPAANMAYLRTWALGSYTLSYTAKDGTTYSQPLFVTLPPAGLFREPSYDFDHYVINGNYQRNISTETDALTLWLLAQNGFSSDAKFTVEMDGKVLTLDENGYATLNNVENAVRFQLEKLDDTSERYGLKITFSDGEALNALLKESRQLQFYVRVESERFSTTSHFTITNTDTTPSGPTAEPGKYTGSTDKKADETVTGGGCVYVRIKDEEQVYSIALAHSSDSGALEPVISSFGSMFDEEAVANNWARGDTLRLAVFTDMTESNYSEAKDMIPQLVDSVKFRITDTSYTGEGTGFLSWDDPVAPTEEAPYYSLYYCISPASGQSGVGYISVDITLKDGVEFVEKPEGGNWQVITPPPKFWYHHCAGPLQDPGNDHH